MAEIVIDPRFPSIEHLKVKAKKRIPRFAFEYLSGGCNNEVNIRKNTSEIREIELKPFYLRKFSGISMKTEVFGQEYDAPFGIAPIGLQGLMWPRATEILSKSAFEHNVPFILSTVATADVETVAKITSSRAWFQLYHPAETDLLKKLLRRVEDAGYPVLVILSDVPTFGYRPKEIKNGLSIPPKLTLSNMLQIASNPNWAVNTLIAGQPEFKTLKPYLPKGLNLKHLGLFMNKMFSGRLNEERILKIRDLWKGKLVIKGVASSEDLQKSIDLGLDGVIISNHGGRQLDAGQSTIAVLKDLIGEFKGKTTIMMDSGMRSGPDIAATLACGADFAFVGRAPMYGVAAMGSKGGSQSISILKRELQQVMEQLCCENVSALSNHLIK